MSNTTYSGCRTPLETLSKTQVSKSLKRTQYKSDHGLYMSIYKQTDEGLAVYALVTKADKVIASFTSADLAAKAMMKFAQGVRLRIKKTRHVVTRPGQSAAMTRRHKIKMLKPSDFTL